MTDLVEMKKKAAGVVKEHEKQEAQTPAQKGEFIAKVSSNDLKDFSFGPYKYSSDKAGAKAMGTNLWNSPSTTFAFNIPNKKNGTIFAATIC